MCWTLLPSEVIKSVVVFSGNADFKTEIPSGVQRIRELAGYMRMEAHEVMSEERLQLCVGRLEIARLAISDETDVEHIESLVRRHGGPPNRCRLGGQRLTGLASAPVDWRIGLTWRLGLATSWPASAEFRVR
jgi:hypothetical protein